VKLLLIDGNSLINRVFYAFGGDGTLSHNGVPTNATYGFLNMLFRGIEDIKPSHVAVAFDVKGPTFRHNLYEQYKGHRKPSNPDLIMQINDTKELLKTMGIQTFEVQGYEADDIIGTLAKKSTIPTIVLTADKDAFQLISDNVELHLTKTGVTKTDVWTLERVLSEFGFPSKSFIDFKSLAGDASDNIPGANGIGEKTATELIRQFQDIENMFTHIDQVKESTRNKLIASKDSIYLSRTLATINTATPLENRELIFSLPLNDKTRIAFQDRGFKSLLKRENLWGKVEHGRAMLDPTIVSPITNQVSFFDPEPQDLEEVKIAEHLITGRTSFTEFTPRPMQEYIDELGRMGLLRLYQEIETPLVPVLHEMQANGAKIEIKALQKTEEEFNKEISTLRTRIHELAGETFNINSPKVLGEVLFKKLGIHSTSKTKKGELTTNEETLQKLLNKHPIIPPLLRYRKVHKLLTTYINGYKNLMTKDGFVHSTFHNTATVTGRLSSSEPNLQNIPARTEDAKRIRGLFTSRFENGSLVCADYSQIELRILAHLSSDQALVDAFKNNRDIHDETAKKLSCDRRTAKAVNFGIVYGISSFGLSQNLNISMQQSAALIESYFKEFPRVKAYLEETKEFAHTNGYVTTLFGRRRQLPELRSTNPNIVAFGTRAAINMPMQGSAADFIKLAMVRIHKKLLERNVKSLIIAQIHDELVFDCPQDEVDTMLKLVKKEMQSVFELAVPLVVDIEARKSL